MTKAEEYRSQSTEELEALQLDLRHKLFDLRCEKRMSGKLEKPHQMRAARRDIARLMTILHERQT